MQQRLGQRSLLFTRAPVIRSYASVVGKKEGEGPLRHGFDAISEDSYFGEKTWEMAESHMLKQCFQLCCDKAGCAPSELDAIFAGDLLNQCVSSSFAMKDSSVPYFGLYGACSTMAEALVLSACHVASGYAECCLALTGSHFCSAERQYRFPLEYGGQRTPSSQWTVTGSGAVMVSAGDSGVTIPMVTPGRIVDAGIKDPNAMGSAMAPAALDTLCAHFADTGRGPADYDAIFTGDLGALGHDLLEHQLEQRGLGPGATYMDCGVLIYDLSTQEVNAGGSGCGCSASVLCGHILPCLEKGIWRRVLFAATGALMSPTSSQQGGSIPGICHAVVLERRD